MFASVFEFSSTQHGLVLLCLFQGIMKLLRTRYYRLYGYQGSLPRLPLPGVKDTVRRVRCLPAGEALSLFTAFRLLPQFLRSVRPFLKDEDYQKMDALSKQFLSGVANRLQFYLTLKSWWASNYVSGWEGQHSCPLVHGRGT